MNGAREGAARRERAWKGYRVRNPSPQRCSSRREEQRQEGGGAASERGGSGSLVEPVDRGGRWGLTRERGGGQREVASGGGEGGTAARALRGPPGRHQGAPALPSHSDGPLLAYLIAVTCQHQQSLHRRLQPRWLGIFHLPLRHWLCQVPA